MMKRIAVLFADHFDSPLSLFWCFACAATSRRTLSELPTEKNILIVYLSRTNNTKAIAEIIHQKVGGTLVALELETPYPADYRATVQQVVRENETGYLPPLKTKIEHVDQYDFVFLGFPTLGNATAATS